MEFGHIGFIQAGKWVRMQDRPLWQKELDTLSRWTKEGVAEETKVVIAVKRWFQGRTVEQLKWFFGNYVKTGADASGYTTDEFFWELKEQCPNFQVDYRDPKTGELKTRQRSLTDPYFTTEKFGEVVTWTYNWLREQFPAMADNLPVPY